MTKIALPDGSVSWVAGSVTNLSGSVSNPPGSVTMSYGSGPIPPPPVPGPMEWTSREAGLTTASKNFDLAAPDMDMGFTTRFTGTPTFSATHGGEPLDVFVTAMNDTDKIASFIFQGRNLTIENKEVIVTCTGGTFGPFAAYMNEVFGPSNDGAAWKEGTVGDTSLTPSQVINNALGGLMRSIYGNVVYSTGTREYRPMNENITDAMGALGVGDEIPGLDFSPPAWSLASGWVIDPNDSNWLLNTGSSTDPCSLSIPSSLAISIVVDVEIPANGSLQFGTNTSVRTYNGPYSGEINNAAPNPSVMLLLKGTAGVRVKYLAVERDSKYLTYIVGSSPDAYQNKAFRVYSGAGLGFALASRQVIAPPQPVDEPEPEPEPSPEPEPDDELPMALGGFVEDYPYGSVARIKPTSAGNLSFLPSTRGAFTFPAPWSTQACRVTDATDCTGAGISHAGYSYWRVINHHKGKPELLVFANCPKAQGGGGPTLFSVSKFTENLDPVKIGPIFPASDSRSNSTAETWFWSNTEAYTLYIVTTEQIQKYDADPSKSLTPAQRTAVVFNIQSQSGYSSSHIKQVSMSHDGNVFAGTLQDNEWEPIGAFTYKVSTNSFVFYPSIRTEFDECQIDKSGRWLVTKENAIDEVSGIHGSGPGNEDNVIYDLDNPSNPPRILGDLKGAAGHSDLGFGYMVAYDNYNNDAGQWRNNSILLWDLTKDPMTRTNAAVQAFHTAATSSVGSHIGFGCANPDRPIAEQFYFNSGVSSSNSAALANELICTRLDGSRKTLPVCPTMGSTTGAGSGDGYSYHPFASCDDEGDFAVFTSNCYSSRLDMFVVRVPVQLLLD